MSKPETPEVWVIQHKETKEIFKAPSGKSSWRKPAHAKNAWGNIRKSCYDKKDVERLTEPLGVLPYPEKLGGNTIWWKFPKFDQQDTWELVKVETQIESKFGEAVLLLNKCLGRITDSKLEKEIQAWLESNNA